MSSPTSLRIATYNIHKCRGMDRRVRPERIAEVIRDLEVDIVALQEVLREEKRDQFELLAELSGFKFSCFGENRKHRGAAYGNAVLSRFSIERWKNYDITAGKREPRGLLRADLRLARGTPLHVLNIHMGTGLLERRRQARRLVHEEVLLSADFSAPRILLGDFNEWTRGLATRMLSSHFRSAEWTRKTAAKRKRSYPGVLPILHLDHVYYDESLKLKTFQLHRSRTALIASDHLPLVACFEIGQVT
ncbi:MAG TPA: endonuclease/exonuclease/phosphatase family protein [Terriglobales bacterium]|nr:endonuclease/exonuclease/phosphatase family protein [Terriglobales bacterium]